MYCYALWQQCWRLQHSGVPMNARSCLEDLAHELRRKVIKGSGITPIMWYGPPG